MIGEPIIAYRAKTTSSISVYLTIPSVFTAPSTAQARTMVYAENNRGQAQTPVTATVSGLVTVTGLASGCTWTLYAISESDANEMSVASLRITVELGASDTNDLSSYFDVPPLDGDGHRAPHEALALFLDAVGFEVHGRAVLGEKLVVGKNLFADYLPEVYKERDKSYMTNP